MSADGDFHRTCEFVAEVVVAVAKGNSEVDLAEVLTTGAVHVKAADRLRNSYLWGGDVDSSVSEAYMDSFRSLDRALEEATEANVKWEAEYGDGA